MSAASAASAAIMCPHDPILRVMEVIDQLQTAHGGSRALDAALDGLIADVQHLISRETAPSSYTPPSGGRWTSSLSDALGLLPRLYNFSLGERDGVSWAWIQPNDRWQPQEHEVRHDHPGGSGLVVAHAPALALTCAVMIVYSRWLMDGPI